MHVDCFINSFFNSNTYILHKDGESLCYIVDIGDWEPVMEYLDVHDLTIGGVLITHGHFDHIYGLNKLVQTFPNAFVWVSEHAKRCLKDAKLNYSHYRDEDFIYNGSEPIKLSDGEEVVLWEDTTVKAIATPGHDKGCLTFMVENFIFTGDSLIPGTKTVTHLRGNATEATESENKITDLVKTFGLIICPGHTIAQK